jgi:nitrogen regulatory protein PII
MKLVTAIIRETLLDKVREALIEAGISRITVSKVSGHGRQKRTELYRGKIVIPNLIPKMKIEIAVNESFVDATIEAIIRGAKTDGTTDETIGDGKIFVTTLDQCIRIRTNEKGSDAI